jgi:hypothetical protein
MADTIFTRNAQLRTDLRALLRRNALAGKPAAALPRPQEKPVLRFDSTAAWDAPAQSNGYIDVVVTMNEINDRHGTGPLLKRIFAGRQGIFSIRSRDDWGIHDFGDWQAKISQQGRSRAECFRSVLRLLAGKPVRTVVCVPFLEDELLTSIAIKEAFHSKLCVYLMDDQNVAANAIRDGLMREFLEKCSLRLATHPELRLAYESKYKLPFYLLPAVVPDDLVVREPVSPSYTPGERRGALIGSFWDQSWFDRLCQELQHCQCHIEWYGNNKSPWLQFPEERMAAAGIHPRGLVPEAKLAEALRNYPFVMVPVGALDKREKNRGVASLSLPGRIPFAAAASHTPILVIGSEETCASRFVKHFGIGLTVPYQSHSIAAAIDYLSETGVQLQMRRNAAKMAAAFSDRDIVAWLPASIDKGCPADTRFEEGFAGYNADRDPSCFSVAGAG